MNCSYTKTCAKLRRRITNKYKRLGPLAARKQALRAERLYATWTQLASDRKRGLQ